MITPKSIKYFFLLSTLVLIFHNGCTQKELIQEIISDPAANKMRIIPANPTSADIIRLVVYDDCNYNTLSAITQNGNTVHIVKHFNSLIMRPCFIRNDTINIGKLPQGNYILNYKLLDNAHTPPKTTLNLNFNLIVSS